MDTDLNEQLWKLHTVELHIGLTNTPTICTSADASDQAILITAIRRV